MIHSEILKTILGIDHGFLTKLTSHELSQHHIFKLCRVKQVHGSNVVSIEDIKKLDQHQTEEADIIITSLPRVALTIATADCVPLLFCDPIKKVVAASHAGWRGTAQNVAHATVQALVHKRGCYTKEVRVAIGPSIQKCCYEVDQKVYDGFLVKIFFTPIPGKKDHWFFSLSEMNQYQLIEAGVLEKNIWRSSLCTACRPDLFYSYRKEPETTHRQFSFIALK